MQAAPASSDVTSRGPPQTPARFLRSLQPTAEFFPTSPLPNRQEARACRAIGSFRPHARDSRRRLRQSSDTARRAPPARRPALDDNSLRPRVAFDSQRRRLPRARSAWNRRKPPTNARATTRRLAGPALRAAFPCTQRGPRQWAERNRVRPYSRRSRAKPLPSRRR